MTESVNNIVFFCRLKSIDIKNAFFFVVAALRLFLHIKAPFQTLNAVNGFLYLFTSQSKRFTLLLFSSPKQSSSLEPRMTSAKHIVRKTHRPQTTRNNTRHKHKGTHPRCKQIPQTYLKEHFHGVRRQNLSYTTTVSQENKHAPTKRK